MIPCSWLRLRIKKHILRIREMLNDKTVCNEAIYHSTQRVAIFARSRNSFAFILITIINPILILISNFSSIYVRELQGIPMAIPILGSQSTEKGIGKMKMVQAPVA